jgi:hypothetical protein
LLASVHVSASPSCSRSTTEVERPAVASPPAGPSATRS